MTAFVRISAGVHRAAIAGKVIDAHTQAPLSGARASIEAGPAAFHSWLSARRQRGQREAHRAITAADGFFGFVDLPAGTYTVQIEGPPNLHHGSITRSFIVQHDAPPSIVSIALAPTGATGKVEAAHTLAPLALARVRVDGMSESFHCDAQGRFVVRGVFPGTCRLSISATGFRSTSITASIQIGQIIDVGTISLSPQGA